MIEAIIFNFLSLVLVAGLFYFAATKFQQGIQIFVRSNVRGLRKQLKAVKRQHADEQDENRRRFDAIDHELKKHGLTPMPGMAGRFTELENRHEKELKLNTVVSVNDTPQAIG